MNNLAYGGIITREIAVAAIIIFADFAREKVARFVSGTTAQNSIIVLTTNFTVHIIGTFYNTGNTFDELRALRIERGIEGFISRLVEDSNIDVGLGF